MEESVQIVQDQRQEPKSVELFIQFQWRMLALDHTPSDSSMNLLHDTPDDFAFPDAWIPNNRHNFVVTFRERSHELAEFPVLGDNQGM